MAKAIVAHRANAPALGDGAGLKVAREGDDQPAHLVAIEAVDAAEREEHPVAGLAGLVAVDLDDLGVADRLARALPCDHLSQEHRSQYRPGQPSASR